MRSSIGIHTMTISKRMEYKEALKLFESFKKFRDETKEIRLRPFIFKKQDLYGVWNEYNKTNCKKIEYIEKNKGLSWEMSVKRENPIYIKCKPCSIKAKITPNVLSGEKDNISAATADVMINIENIFNGEAERISPLLSSFDLYTHSRIDYCFNGDVAELNVGCSPVQMMSLIKRGRIPSNFEEWKGAYNKVSHRYKSDKYSFYLKNRSVVINCYCKAKQWEREYPNNPYIEDARNVVRFEVQCKYPKVYAMLARIRKMDDCDDYVMLKRMHDNSFCRGIIEKYFHKIVGKGDYFTLEGAIWMVEKQGFKQNKKDRLIYALERINESRGISKAEAKLSGEEWKDFRRSLKDLDRICVNPVTIPRDWGIKHIPNLLRAYFCTISEVRFLLPNEVRAYKLLEEYLSK